MMSDQAVPFVFIIHCCEHLCLPPVHFLAQRGHVTLCVLLYHAARLPGGRLDFFAVRAECLRAGHFLPSSPVVEDRGLGDVRLLPVYHLPLPNYTIPLPRPLPHLYTASPRTTTTLPSTLYYLPGSFTSHHWPAPYLPRLPRCRTRTAPRRATCHRTRYSLAPGRYQPPDCHAYYRGRDTFCSTHASVARRRC